MECTTHEVQQDDIVHDRTDGKLRYELIHTEEFQGLVAQEGRHQAILAVARQSVEDFAGLLLILQAAHVTRHPVDDQPFDPVRFDGPGEARTREST